LGEQHPGQEARGGGGGEGAPNISPMGAPQLWLTWPWLAPPPQVAAVNEAVHEEVVPMLLA